MSKKSITLQEVLGENLKKAIAEIETVENTYERVTLRLELVNTIHKLKGQEVEIPDKEGREALDNTKKKTTNKKAKAVQDAVDKVIDQTDVVEEETTPEITPEPAQEVQPEAEQTSAEAEEVAEQEIDNSPMLMDDGNGGEIDIRPYYNALAIFEPTLDETKQYIAYYASLYDLSEMVSAFSQGISNDIYELLNDDNAAAFYDYLVASMQG